MKTKNFNTDSDYLFEKVLAKRYEITPDAEFTKRDEDNMVKRILNRVEVEEPEPMGFFAMIIEKITDFTNSSRLLTFGTPAFNTAVVVIMSVTISALFYNDFMKDPENIMNNTAYVQQSEQPESIADNNEVLAVSDQLQSRDPVIYNVTQKTIGNLILTQETRSLDFLFSDINNDSLNYLNALNIAVNVLVNNNINIEKKSNAGLETDWIMNEYKGKLYKHKLIVIGDISDYSQIRFALKSQQLDKEFSDTDNVRNDINFYDIIDKIKIRSLEKIE